MTDPWLLATALACVLVAALIRGYSGFGFAIAGVPLLSLVYAPTLAVPMVMLLQALSGLQTFRQDRHDIDFKAVWLLLPASLIGLVPGLLLLAWLPADPARLAIGLIVVATVLILARGWRFVRFPPNPVVAGIGLVSGVMNGFSAMAGPPVIALYFASDERPVVVRATLVFYFMVTSIAGLAFAWWRGLIDAGGLLLTLALWPALFLGTHAGGRLFQSRFQVYYRPVGLVLLAAIGLLAVIRAGFGLLG